MDLSFLVALRVLYAILIANGSWAVCDCLGDSAPPILGQVRGKVSFLICNVRGCVPFLR